MPRTVYEKPSRISQGLVVGLSAAVVLMAGWLAATIMLSNYATTSVVDDANEASAPVDAENVSPEPEKPRVAPQVATRANSAYFEPLPQDDTSTTPTPPQSAPPAASFAEPPATATGDPGYAPSSTATAGLGVHYGSIPALTPYLPPRAPALVSSARGGGPRRGQLAEGREEAVRSIDATEAIADLMRPPPTPSSYSPQRAAEGRPGAAPVPVPRPRPRLEGEDIQPVAQDQPSADFLVDRRR
jgi:hypothetical protein